MLFAIFLSVATGGFQDLDSLDRRIAQFTGAGIGEPGGAIHPLDRRLKLRRCGEAVEIAWRRTEQRAVALHCPEPDGWRLYVAIKPAVQANGTAQEAVINRGDSVVITVAGSGFSLTRPAEALESGAVGEWIRIRPASADRRQSEVLRARVMGAGSVTLPAG